MAKRPPPGRTARPTQEGHKASAKALLSRGLDAMRTPQGLLAIAEQRERWTDEADGEETRRPSAGMAALHSFPRGAPAVTRMPPPAKAARGWPSARRPWPRQGHRRNGAQATVDAAVISRRSAEPEGSGPPEVPAVLQSDGAEEVTAGARPSSLEADPGSAKNNRSTSNQAQEGALALATQPADQGGQAKTAAMGARLRSERYQGGLANRAQYLTRRPDHWLQSTGASFSSSPVSSAAAERNYKAHGDEFPPMIIRLAWGIGKFAVKHVLVPIAITAVTAIVLEKLADRVAPKETDGMSASASSSDRPSRPSRASMAV